jgi:hypothetical protein
MPLPAGLPALFYRFPPTGKRLASHAGVRHEDGRSAIHAMARQILPRYKGTGDVNAAASFECSME